MLKAEIRKRAAQSHTLAKAEMLKAES